MASLEVAQAETRADLRNHLAICARSSAIVQRLCWFILSVVATLLGFVLQARLGIHL